MPNSRAAKEDSSPVTDLHAVLLAAGGSSRLGRAKQLLCYRGETLVARAARLLRALTPTVTVVTGARGSEVAAAVAALDVSVCHNARWRQGVGASIALATRRFEPATSAALVMLCDQYRLEAPDLEALVTAWRSAPECITASRYGAHFGPPVIFPARCFARLARLRGDQGARQLLVEERAQVQGVELPNAAVDLDDAADLERLRAWERESLGPERSVDA